MQHRSALNNPSVAYVVHSRHKAQDLCGENSTSVLQRIESLKIQVVICKSDEGTIESKKIIGTMNGPNTVPDASR